ncbi:HU family DNA-binding protein [Bacillus bombysepticus]|uniref:HU family DNA-binding protein n=1 Tax=Bacillus bombysepticus TaxID=658666 RepID=UPI00301944BE
MTKKDLLIRVCEKTGISKKEAKIVIEATFEAITDIVTEGRKLTVVNFGVFEKKKRNSKKGTNPVTGEHIMIPEKYVANFRPGEMLKKKVNQ